MGTILRCRIEFNNSFITDIFMFITYPEISNVTVNKNSLSMAVLSYTLIVKRMSSIFAFMISVLTCVMKNIGKRSIRTSILLYIRDLL